MVLLENKAPLTLTFRCQERPLSITEWDEVQDFFLLSAMSVPELEQLLATHAEQQFFLLSLSESAVQADLTERYHNLRGWRDGYQDRSIQFAEEVTDDTIYEEYVDLLVQSGKRIVMLLPSFFFSFVLREGSLGQDNSLVPLTPEKMATVREFMRLVEHINRICVVASDAEAASFLDRLYLVNETFSFPAKTK